METAEKKKMRPEAILGMIALCCAGLLIVMVLLCLPYFDVDEDPETIVHHKLNTETEAPDPTGETVPTPEANPHGRLDFQYEGRYLSSLRCDSMPGIDVSSYQGEIDWQAVADSGIKFAIIRLGYRGYGQEGKLAEDKMAYQNIEGALEAGLKVGIYFFSQAITVEEAVEEAEFVLKRIEKYDITMPIVYDWEYISEEARTAKMDRRTLTECYKAFCEKITEAGYTPMAYFNSYQSKNLMYLTELEQYPFWLALYSDRMASPSPVEMWQYTDAAIAICIEGNVDINLYFVNEYF